MAISLSKIVQNWRFLRIFGDYFAKPCLRIVGFETGEYVKCTKITLRVACECNQIASLNYRR